MLLTVLQAISQSLVYIGVIFRKYKPSVHIMQMPFLTRCVITVALSSWTETFLSSVYFPKVITWIDNNSLVVARMKTSIWPKFSNGGCNIKQEPARETVATGMQLRIREEIAFQSFESFSKTELVGLRLLSCFWVWLHVFRRWGCEVPSKAGPWLLNHPMCTLCTCLLFNTGYTQ